LGLFPLTVLAVLFVKTKDWNKEHSESREEKKEADTPLWAALVHDL